MNCALFKNVVVELARGSRMLEASTRQDGLSHAESCQACGRLLAEQQILSMNLRAYGEDHASSTTAPAQLEAELRAAFRAHYKAAAPPTMIRKRPYVRAWIGRRSFVAAAAIAAIVLVVVAPRVYQHTQQAPIGAAQLPPPDSSPAINDKSSAVAASPQTINEQADQIFASGLGPRKPKRPATARPGRSAFSASRLTTTPQVEAPRAEEIVTDFFALGENASQSPLDGGQIVRVAVPRSTLMSFGLPVNMERESEAVKAELLLGHDGVARAIRFVK